MLLPDIGCQNLRVTKKRKNLELQVINMNLFTSNTESYCNFDFLIIINNMW